MPCTWPTLIESLASPLPISFPFQLSPPPTPLGLTGGQISLFFYLSTLCIHYTFLERYVRLGITSYAQSLLPASSVLRDHTWWCFGDHVCSAESNQGWPSTRDALYPRTYTISLEPHSSSNLSGQGKRNKTDQS